MPSLLYETKLREDLAMATDAAVNWCWNTEAHLREARRLKAEAARLPQSSEVGTPFRRWNRQAQQLIARIGEEVCKAEPDTSEVCGYAFSRIAPKDFLAEIPDPD